MKKFDEVWEIGKLNSTIVSDKVVINTNFPSPPNPPFSHAEDKEYYGGYLICESIGNKQHANLISAAPDMYEALKNIENDDNRIPQTIWDMIQNAIKKAEGNSN